MKQSISLSISLLVFAVLLATCGGEQKPTSTVTDTYRVEAVLYKNLDDGEANIDLCLIKNGVMYKGANITLDTIPLDTNVCGYTKRFSPSQVLVNSSYILNITDGSKLDLDIPILVPQSFSIVDVGFRNFTGSPEAVSWTASTNLDGYILATVPPDSAVTDDGYEEYVAVTNGSIPAETFSYNQERIIGSHMIYVTAYSGAPVEFPTLPFAIPATGGPADSVWAKNVTGRVAGMVIAAPDSIFVGT